MSTVVSKARSVERRTYNMIPDSQAASFLVSPWRCSVSTSDATKQVGESPFACATGCQYTPEAKTPRSKMECTHHAIADALVELFEHLGLCLVPLEALALPLSEPRRDVLQDGERVNEVPPRRKRARNMHRVRVHAL